MSVPFQQLHVLVAGDGRHLHEANPFLKKAIGSLMAQVMKSESVILSMFL